MARWRKDSTWTKELRYQTIHQSLLVQCDLRHFAALLLMKDMKKSIREISKSWRFQCCFFFQSLQMDGRNFPVSNLQVSRLPRCTWYPMPGPHQLWKSSPWQPWNHCSQEVPRAMGGHLADVQKGRVGGHKTASTKRYRHIWCIIYLYVFIHFYSYIYIQALQLINLQKRLNCVWCNLFCAPRKRWNISDGNQEGPGKASLCW